jgi:hypothetical protein
MIDIAAHCSNPHSSNAPAKGFQPLSLRFRPEDRIETNITRITPSTSKSRLIRNPTDLHIVQKYWSVVLQSA